MNPARPPRVDWVVLTLGDRPAELRSALASLERGESSTSITVVFNGSVADTSASGDAQVITVAENIGVPGGRDIGLQHTGAPIVGFLDDDAVASTDVVAIAYAAFAADDRLGAVALRLVDEDGHTARRHVPRLGGRDPEVGGEVALFLGGACAVRREAYDDADGYWSELFYGHEELELSWRLIDRGWKIRYLPDAVVFHPRTEIGRHAEGWRMTGRNRVAIARRTLPWPVAIAHVTAWLLLGTWRAPGRTGRAAYLRGWRSGWSMPVDRRPIRWRTVWRLTRLGRPPVV